MKTLTWIDTAVCLGNGQSRQGLDLNKMKDHATVIGCNAIYRDFTPDILVALDSRISHEIYRKANHNNMKIHLGYWTPVPIYVAKEMLKTMADKTDIVWNDSEEVVYHVLIVCLTLKRDIILALLYIPVVSK